MTYAEFLVGIDELIRRGDLKPIWWRVVRSEAYRELLFRTDMVTGPRSRNPAKGA